MIMSLKIFAFWSQISAVNDYTLELHLATQEQSRYLYSLTDCLWVLGRREPHTLPNICSNSGELLEVSRSEMSNLALTARSSTTEAKNLALAAISIRVEENLMRERAARRCTVTSQWSPIDDLLFRNSPARPSSLWDLRSNDFSIWSSLLHTNWCVSTLLLLLVWVRMGQETIFTASCILEN